jgi:Tfp pilus assembly protein PilX
MRRDSFRERAALIVAIIFLLLLSTLALTGLRASTTNVTIAGNMQARQEVTAAAQMLIEQTISSDEFARNPQGVSRRPPDRFQ